MQSKEDKEFCEKLKSISFGTIQGGTPKFYKRNHEDMTALYREMNNPLAEITKDKAMFKTITQGNSGDKKLTEDVKAMERERVSSRKAKSREDKKERITKLKKEYKRKYGTEA